MIRGDHARQELREGVKKFEEAKDVKEQVAIMFKLVTVILKVVLSTRLNTSKIMDTVGAEKVVPKKREETSEEGEKKEE